MRQISLAVAAAACLFGTSAVAAPALLLKNSSEIVLAESKEPNDWKVKEKDKEKKEDWKESQESKEWKAKEKEKEKKEEWKESKESKECNDWRYPRIWSLSKPCKHHHGYENIFEREGLHGRLSHDRLP